MATAEPGAPIERFHRYLRDRRLPVTRQRDLVADAVLATDDHLSVDAIERQLRAQGATVGTATVYRTLELLVAAGLIRAHDFGEGFRRYEPVGRVCVRRRPPRSVVHVVSQRILAVFRPQSNSSWISSVPTSMRRVPFIGSHRVS